MNDENNVRKKKGGAALTYSLIVLGTLLLLEGLSFAYMVVGGTGQGEKLSDAIASVIKLHPWARINIGFGNYDPIVLARFEPGTMIGRMGINQHGFIHNGHDDPILNAFPGKPENVTRIVLIGGSSMAGNALPSDNTQTISAHLERILNVQAADADSSGKRKFQVLNYGLSGAFSSDELARFFNEVIYLDPDVVVTLDGWNDAIAIAFEHRRNDIPIPLLHWGSLAYLYYDHMRGLDEKPRAPPAVFTYTYLVLEQAGLIDTKSADRLSTYKSNPVFGLSKHLLDERGSLSFVLPRNNSAIAAYSADNAISYIGYLQPFAGYRRKLVKEEDALLDTRHALLSKVHGDVWGREKYRSLIEGVFEDYHDSFKDLAERYKESPWVEFMDISDIFQNTEEIVYLDQIHYNDYGNEVLAKRFAVDINRMLAKRPR